LTWLAVAVGGAVGAACRYVVDFVVSERSRGVFPWGTWTVNMTGALLLGLLAGMTAGRGDPQLWHVAATSGFCGAFTTFSTLMYETLQLIGRRAWWEATWNLCSQVVGLGAAACGWLVAMLLPG
jgi:CrcB protein